MWFLETDCDMSFSAIHTHLTRLTVIHVGMSFLFQTNWIHVSNVRKTSYRGLSKDVNVVEFLMLVDVTNVPVPCICQIIPHMIAGKIQICGSTNSGETTVNGPSKQLGSETEAKFSRLQDVVPNVTKTEPNLFKYFGTTL